MNKTISNYEYNEVGQQKRKIYLPDDTFTFGGAKDYIRRPSIDGIVNQNNTQDIARKAIVLEPNSSIKAIELNTYKAEINPNAQQGLSIIGLQKLDFSWHIRGGLRGINLDASLNPIPNTSEADLFAYKLDYETAGYWDGNIGKQTWATQNATTNALETRSYTHNYDASSRLKFSTYTGIGNENFSIINMGYDKNGNITNLQRNGRFGTTGAFGPIDNLSYGYSGNRLNYVVDAIGGDNTVDFVQRGGANYTYWNDGSIKSDANEQIANITYNSFLKQQSEILLTDGRKIKYTYNGAGELINTSYFDASNTIIEKWDFVESTIYKNDVLYQISDDEGRILYANDSYNYEFDYKDHLGNTRTSFQAIGGVLEKTAETAFDPWGVRLNIGLVNAYQNRFEIQGKESEKTFGLNRINLGARTVNPTIGRFDGVDQKADKYASISTFAYVANNPLKYLDPDGKEIILILSRDAKGRVEKSIRYNQGKFYSTDGKEYKSDAGFSKRIKESIDKIRSSDSYLEKIISTLETTKNKHYIEFSSDKEQNSRVTGVNNEGGLPVEGSRMTINFSDVSGNFDDGLENNLETTMTHEFSHQYDRETKKEDNVKPEDDGTERDTKEIRAVNIENRYRINNNLGIRTRYGKPIESKLLENPKTPKL